MATVARQLAAAGVVRSAPLFEIAAGLTERQGPLHAAEFAFPAHASVADVLAVLRFGAPVLHRLTIAEGLTAAQVARVLTDADWLAGDVAVPPEGSVLPQTYAFERGTARAVATARATAALREALAAAWRDRAPGLPLRSPREALILASLIERETAMPAERPMVAGVFTNRLRLGMKLQSDPTAAYGASGGAGFMARALDRGDLARPDALNTYVIAGLPAAPICNPGLASIAAALHPAAIRALYFVADGSGGHAFADDLATHLRNVARRGQRQ